MVINFFVSTTSVDLSIPGPSHHTSWDFLHSLQVIENKTNLALCYTFPVSVKFNFDFTIRTAAIEKLKRRMPGRKSGHNGGKEAKVFQIICLRQQAERLRNVMPFVFLLRIYPQKFSTARSRRARAICRSTSPAPRVAQKFIYGKKLKAKREEERKKQM